MSSQNGTTNYQYDSPAGRLVSMSHSRGISLSMTYDGRLPTSFAWSEGAFRASVALTYNADFLVTAQTAGLSAAVSFAYDSDGLIAQAGALSIARDARTLVTGTLLGTVSTTTEHDSLAQPVRMRATFGNSVIFDESYQRDGAGRVVGITESSPGSAGSKQFSYDASGQLTIVSQNGSPRAAYEYDANGNRIGVVRPSGTERLAFDAHDRLIGGGRLSFKYTPSGHLSDRVVGIDTTRFDYGVLGDLRAVTLPSGRLIQYDGDPTSRRVAKRLDGVLVARYVYSGQSLVAELDPNGSVISRYVYGTNERAPDYVVRAGRTYRVVRDAIESVRLVVDVTSGEIVQQLSYDEFGRVLVDTRPGFQMFGFAGGLYDAETGLVRIGVRDYDAASGRWTSKDPILFESGESNLYRYARNSPLSQTDPTGLCADCSLVGQSMAVTFFGTMLANQLLSRPLLQDVVRNTAMVGLAAYGAAVALPAILDATAAIALRTGFAAGGSGAVRVILGRGDDVKAHIRQVGDVILDIPPSVANRLGWGVQNGINWAWIRYWQLRGADFSTVSRLSVDNLINQTGSRAGLETIFGMEMRWMLGQSGGLFDVGRITFH